MPYLELKITRTEPYKISGTTYYIKHYLKNEFCRWNPENREWICPETSTFDIDTFMELLHDLGLKCEENDEYIICRGYVSKRRLAKVLAGYEYAEIANAVEYGATYSGKIEVRRSEIEREIERELS